MRLATAMIFVKDLARMTEFYRDVMGLKPDTATQTETYVEFDGARLALHGIPSDIARTIEIESPARPREKSPAKLIFESADPVQERVRLKALGVMFLARPWGGYDGVDPEGNVFGLRKPASYNSIL